MIVVYFNNGLVNRQILPIRTLKPIQLRIKITKSPSLQQRIIRKIDPGDNMRSTKRHLFDFRKEVVGVFGECHFTDGCNGDEGFGDNFGRVEEIEVEGELVFFVDYLDAEFVFGKVAAVDGFVEILALPVGIFAGEFLGFVPDLYRWVLVNKSVGD